ncbi:malto-oligosyltrehalose trehalohydrolase [Ilyomonas limi]|nr:malto-oligosyltrehalose trehalohydrolase [Ilyomonas limi]
MNIGAQYLQNNTTRFTVWAPEKETMQLHVVHPKEQKLQMQKDNDGYFSVTADNVQPGSHYFFKPDGKQDYPDPASSYQPEDVFGASAVIDHEAYQWHDENWHGLPFEDFIFYELHVGTFTPEGTFEAIIPYLNDLAETGINAIELMPVNQFSGNRNWGYDATYLYAVHHSYGGPKGLKKLVDACHQKGIAVFLDIVYNHLGPEGNFLPEYAPYFTDKYCTPWGDALNFDDEWSDGVREYISDNPVYWFKNYHIDGLRLDAIHEMYDKGAINIWQLMQQKVAQAEQQSGRRLYLVAECDLNSPRVVKNTGEGGWGFDAQWLDDFHHILYIFLDKEGKDRYVDFYRMEQLAKAYKEGFVHSGEWVQFRKRRHGTSSAGVPGNRFVAFNLNHDQAGNRIGGERLSVLISFEKQKLAAAALLLSPYIPMLFMGEEYGEDTPFFFFISHHDTSNIKAVQEGRRKEFANYGLREGEDFPDPYDEDTFNRCKLQWHKRKEGKYKIMLDWITTLIQLRRTNEMLKNFNKNNLQAYNINQDGLIVIRQDDAGKKFLVCCFNFSDKAIAYTLPSYKEHWHKTLDSKEQQWMVDEAPQSLQADVKGGEIIQLQPCGAVVYSSL